MSDTSELIAHALDQKAVDFENAFSDILQSKLVDAIDVRKKEIAVNLFNNEPKEIEDDAVEIEPDTEVVQDTDTEEEQDG